MKLLPSFLLVSLTLTVSGHSQNTVAPDESPYSVQVLNTVTNLSGIAAILRRLPESGAIIVVGLIKDGPAAKAGLAINDIIVEVDGWATTGEQLESVVTRLRGAPGTKVTLKIERDGVPQSIEIIRDIVKLEEVVTPLEITLKAGQYWIGGHEVSPDMLATILQDRASRDKSWPVKIQADQQTPYPSLQRILEKCRDAKLINVEVISPNDTKQKITQ